MITESNGGGMRLYLWWRWQQIACLFRGHVFGVHGDGEGNDWLCCENCGGRRDL